MSTFLLHISQSRKEQVLTAGMNPLQKRWLWVFRDPSKSPPRIIEHLHLPDRRASDFCVASQRCVRAIPFPLSHDRTFMLCPLARDSKFPHSSGYVLCVTFLRYNQDLRMPLNPRSVLNVLPLDPGSRACTYPEPATYMLHLCHARSLNLHCSSFPRAFTLRVFWRHTPLCSG